MLFFYARDIITSTARARNVLYLKHTAFYEGENDEESLLIQFKSLDDFSLAFHFSLLLL